VSGSRARRADCCARRAPSPLPQDEPAAAWRNLMPNKTRRSKYVLARRLLVVVALGAVTLAAALDASTQNTSQSSQRYPARQAPPAPPDYRISVAGYRFDPLRGEPQLREELRAARRPDRPAYHIIQFNKSLTRAERARLQRSYGLRLRDYIPNLAYLERVSAQTLTALSKEPTFRASLPYHPAFKIDPQIGERKFVTERRRAVAGFLLLVQLFPEADVDAAARDVAGYDGRLLGRTDDSKKGGPKRLRVNVPGRLQIEAIARLEEVQWIEEEGDATLDNATSAAVVQSDTAAQTPLYNQGLRGEGQIVGLIDATLDMNHCFFNDPANAAAGPSHRKVVGYRQDNAATFNAAQGCIPGHGTHTGGTVAGQSTAVGNNGVAMNARLTYGDTSDISAFGGTRSFLSYLDAAAGDGAFIHSNSWSDKSTTNYTVLSQDLDTFTWNNEDQLVVVSSSNNIDTNGDGVQDSPSVVRPPWTSKNGLPVAASVTAPNQTSVSSGGVGPTNDGRRKPEIYAPGSATNSAQAGTNCGLQACGGSSMATPAVAGAAALARQYYTEGFYPSGTRQPHNSFTPSGALLKATLLNSTRDMNGNDAFGAAGPLNGYPSNLEGWGRLVLDDSLFFAGDARNLRVWDFHNVEGLLTGETRQQIVNVASNTMPLKITLVWTDPPPAAAGFANPVVNDLNLTVTSPGGAQTFVGNDFVGGATPADSGAAADTLNNVEMVLVNNPAPGAWTITVSGAAVNQGNPGQGYALVATADLTEPPAPTGAQDTLVVRVKFNDISFEPPLANLQNKINDTVAYVSEVSYGQATVAPDYFPNVVTTDNPKDFYYHPSRSLLIELTEEVAAKLIAADPNVFTKGTPAAADDVDRLVLVTNDINFTEDRATTGPWPYDMPGGFTRPLSVSVQSYDNSAARFNHGLTHQLGLVDLYAHPGVVFPRAYVDEWDNMAGLFTNVHPLLWSKQLATWVTGAGSQIEYVARPAAGATTGPTTFSIFSQEAAAGNRKGVAIGLTQGAATLAAEDVFYFVEARDKTFSPLEAGLPTGGALIYFVNERIPQGQGPVILLDDEPGTPSLSDAAFEVGDVRDIPGTGIRVEVLAPTTAGAAFDIRVTYTPPATDYNVSITKGDTIDGEFYGYFSPDIWIDSPKNGLGNLAGGPPPNDQIEDPVVGQVNRIYARVNNAGPGTAFDFDVRFRVSEPFHTVGGEADFDTFVGLKHVAGLVPAGTSVPASPPGMVSAPTIVFVEWTPADDGDPHSCVYVDLINLVGTDTNQFDNGAQENLQEVTSVTGSPYHPVSYSFELTNPYAQASLFYFRAEGAPPGWSVVLTPRKALLNPGERVQGTAVVTPPPDAPICTSRRIQVTSWAPRGDTITPVGGAVVNVLLRKPTLLTFDGGSALCDRTDLKLLDPEVIKRYRVRGPEDLECFCRRVAVHGCTNPALANQEIVVKFTDQDGKAVYHTVHTDANGCFEDFLVTDSGSVWQATAEYEGDKCQGGAETKPIGPFWKCKPRDEPKKKKKKS
jgi:hypothetical protein